MKRIFLTAAAFLIAVTPAFSADRSESSQTGSTTSMGAYDTQGGTQSGKTARKKTTQGSAGTAMDTTSTGTGMTSGGTSTR